MVSEKVISLTNSKVTSAVSITLVLFLLGVVVMMGFVANELSIFVRENITFSLIVNNDDAQEVERIQRELKRSQFAKEVRYISKEDALVELTEELGEDPSVFTGYNPLKGSFEIKLKAEYANPDSLKWIERQISQKTSIKDIQYRQDMVQLVSENISKIRRVLLILAILLLMISYTLIKNTIRLQVHSKRFLIYTMRLVGATNAFIQWPFVRVSILSGIIAAMLANLSIFGLVYMISENMGGLAFLMKPTILIPSFALVVIFGIVISFFAAWLSTRKYLRMSQGKMHLI